MLVVTTNSAEYMQVSMPYLPYSPGQMVCNAFDVNDCVEVTDTGMDVSIMENPKIYLPKTSAFFGEVAAVEESPEILTI